MSCYFVSFVRGVCHFPYSEQDSSELLPFAFDLSLDFQYCSES